jgi:hypothetical protein
VQPDHQLSIANQKHVAAIKRCNSMKEKYAIKEHLLISCTKDSISIKRI